MSKVRGLSRCIFSLNYCTCKKIVQTLMFRCLVISTTQDVDGCLGDVEQALDLINELDEVMTLDKQLDLTEDHSKFKEVSIRICVSIVWTQV